MPKGQSIVEFQLSFVAALLAVAMLAGALSAHKEALEAKTMDMKRINTVESAARAIEAAANTGIQTDFDLADQNVSYAAEENRIYVYYGEDVIEINGVFDGEELEPL